MKGVKAKDIPVEQEIYVLVWEKHKEFRDVKTDDDWEKVINETDIYLKEFKKQATKKDFQLARILFNGMLEFLEFANKEE